MTKKLCRSAVVLTATLACLALMASPASATTHNTDITGGTFTLNNTTGTFPVNFTFEESGGAGCGTAMTVNETGTTIDITAYATTSRSSPIGGTNYVSVITRTASTAGSSSAGVITSETLTLRYDIWVAANQGTATDCATTGTRVCSLRVTYHLVGTYTGVTASSTVALGSSTAATVSAVIGATCSAPFSVLIGGPATANSLGYHLTT